MRAKINDIGCMTVWKLGRWHEQFCPHRAAVTCSIRCPLFVVLEGEKGTSVLLKCAQGALRYDIEK